MESIRVWELDVHSIFEWLMEDDEVEVIDPWTMQLDTYDECMLLIEDAAAESL